MVQTIQQHLTPNEGILSSHPTNLHFSLPQQTYLKPPTFHTTVRNNLKCTNWSSISGNHETICLPPHPQISVHLSPSNPPSFFKHSKQSGGWSKSAVVPVRFENARRQRNRQGGVLATYVRYRDHLRPATEAPRPQQLLSTLSAIFSAPFRFPLAPHSYPSRRLTIFVMKVHQTACSLERTACDIRRMLRLRLRLRSR